MSYDHRTVEYILKKTSEYSSNPKCSYEPGTVHKTAPGLTVLVSDPVYNFAKELAAQHRNIKFGVDNYCSAVNTNVGKMLFTELWVYFEGDEYAVAKIGFDDYSLNREGKRKYMVFARTISNDKFKSHRDQYNMAFAEKLPVAVRNFNTHLRRYTIHDIANMSVSDVRSSVYAANINHNQGLKTAWLGVANNSDLRSELMHLVETGYKFLSQSLQDAIVKYIDVKEEDKQRNVLRDAYFVRVTTDHTGQQIFNLLFYSDVENRHVADPHPKVFTYEQLMEFNADLCMRLATVTMLNRGQYVEGVGQRVNDTTFWVMV